MVGCPEEITTAVRGCGLRALIQKVPDLVACMGSQKKEIAGAPRGSLGNGMGPEP
jgi:hypothetical protein